MNANIQRWLVVTPTGELIWQGEEPTLDALQSAVGGDIEAMPSPASDLHVSVFVNENANRDGLPANPKATAFLLPLLWPGQRILGAMVIAGAADAEGELTDLTHLQVRRLEEALT